MNSQSQGYVQEIEFQIHMLDNLKKWLKIALLVSSLGVLLIYIFTNSTPLKILGIVVLVISIVLALIIGLAIYKGRKNVNLVIDELSLLKKSLISFMAYFNIAKRSTPIPKANPEYISVSIPTFLSTLT